MVYGKCDTCRSDKYSSYGGKSSNRNIFYCSKCDKVFYQEVYKNDE